MPLFDSLKVNYNNLFLWKIVESQDELKNLLNLSDSLNSRLNKIKSTSQRKQFLGVQNLLKLLKIETSELIYDSNGKPKLLNNNFISISHSFDYCGVVLSKFKVGLDIEKLRPKILTISKKFISPLELNLIRDRSIENLTKVWTIKEAVFKAFGYSGIDFKENILIESINIEFDRAKVKVYKNEIIEYYNIEIINFSQYICSVAYIIK